ncbi:MAG: cysteine desulfurase [Pirellulaceae bacterium]|nr:MAG: cysteine desulfurase [Pirellulaceae bacterium]
MRTIFLDHCSSTPVASSARAAMLDYIDHCCGHPAGEHWHSRVACEAIEDAKSAVAQLLQCHPSEVVFTSGGTEAIHLALLGSARVIPPERRPCHLIATRIDHDAVLDCVAQLEQEGWRTTLLDCHSDGTFSVEHLQRALDSQTRLVSLPYLNPRTGAVQPIEEAAALCQRHDVRLHVDACLAVGRLPISLSQTDIDLLSISGHKMHGLPGAGALFIRTGTQLAPLMPSRVGTLRSGMPSIPAIVALGAAAHLAASGIEVAMEYARELRHAFLAHLHQAAGFEPVVHTGSGENWPGIISLEQPGVDTLTLRRDLAHLCLGPPALFRDQVDDHTVHCVVDRIYAAMGWDARRAAQTLQLAVGWQTQQEDVQHAAAAIGEQARRLRGE